MTRQAVIRSRATGEVVHRIDVQPGTDEDRLERGMAMRVDFERFTFEFEGEQEVPA